MAESVETLGVDLRSQTKKQGAKEKARRKKCDVRFSLIKKNRVFQKNYIQTGVRKLLRTGLVPPRAWRAQAVGVAPTERLKLRRLMADRFRYLLMEVDNLEVVEEFSTMATFFWAEGTWMGIGARANKSLEKADL